MPTTEVTVTKSAPGRYTVVHVGVVIGWVDKSSEGGWIVAVPSESNPSKGVVVDRNARTRRDGVQEVCGQYNRYARRTRTEAAHKGWTF